MPTQENLSVSDRIIQTVLPYAGHAYHGRPGIKERDTSSPTGIKWSWVVPNYEPGQPTKIMKIQGPRGKKQAVQIGTVVGNNKIHNLQGVEIGEYQEPGLVPEVVTWIYKQIVEVWKLDNEFSARWASFAFGQEHEDLKLILAAFMLVQNRKGDPVRDGDMVFYDENFRHVGGAMVLLTEKGKNLNAKHLLRMYKVLTIPGVAEVNRSLGFTASARRPFLGSWKPIVRSWLEYRENNPKLLDGLIKAGFTKILRKLARFSQYPPLNPTFFDKLHWKQKQSKDGHRKILGGNHLAGDTWEGLTESQICEKIVQDKPKFMRIFGSIPKSVGLTRAILAASIESECLSNKELINITPTLEELGLLQVPDVKARWEKALASAENMRAANIAANVRSKEAQEKLVDAADTAAKKIVEEVMRDMRVYFMVDTSGSMTLGIERAKECIAKFLQSFPPDKVHVSVFNNMGREVKIQVPSKAGVENAFRGIGACGGTEYGAGVRALQHYKPLPNEDVLFFFVGDEEAGSFEHFVRQSGLNPTAFGLLKVGGGPHTSAVRSTAAVLGIPCLIVQEDTFADVFAIPRTIRNLIAATPVTASGYTAPKRESLAETIAKTSLLQMPPWALPVKEVVKTEATS